MKKQLFFLTLALSSLLFTQSCCERRVRTARDITPGNLPECHLDWKYGANDIRIQTTKLTRHLVGRWLAKTGYCPVTMGKPSLIITHVDNRTDTYISSDMIRDIFEGIAINDGRFTVTVGDWQDERELDCLLAKFRHNPKYQNSTTPPSNLATAPHFLVKIRLTKAVNHLPCSDIEEYRMSITLYDVVTQEAIDQASDTLIKQVQV